MQGGQRVGLVAVAGATPEGSITAQSEPRNHREREQYPDENEGVYDQVADVVFAAWERTRPGSPSLVTDLGEQSFCGIGVGWR